MKETSEKAAQIRADLWLRLDRITVPLQLGRWAGDAFNARHHKTVRRHGSVYGMTMADLVYGNAR